MSNKGIADPLFVDLAARCCRLDRISNEIHSALRADAGASHQIREILIELEQAVSLCGQIVGIELRKKSSSLDPLHGVSFALRAAHEVTEALILADKARRDRQEEPKRAAEEDLRN